MKSLKQQADALAAQGVTLNYDLPGLAEGTPEYDAFIAKLGVVERFMGFTYGGARGQARFTPLDAGSGYVSVILDPWQIDNISLAYEWFKTGVFESLNLESRLWHYYDLAEIIEVNGEFVSDFTAMETAFRNAILANPREGLIDLIEMISSLGYNDFNAMGWDAIGFMVAQLNSAPDTGAFTEELHAWTVQLTDPGETILYGTSRPDLLVGNAGDNSLNGSDDNDVLVGKGGNDTLSGELGADILAGGLGNDSLSGMAGNDTLDGGAGNDDLYGETGNDIYLFASGDGQDTVSDYDAAAGNTDSIRFKSGIASADVVIGRDDVHLLLSIGASGDKITVNNWFADTAFRIEQVEFADGTVWNAAYIQSAARIRGTAGVDYLAGSAGDDYLEAYAGNDSLNGGAGNDTLDGGTGNDDLYGETGNDIYLFASGDGQDTVSDYDAAAGNTDSIRFKSGIASADVVIGRDDVHLLLSIGASGDKITVNNWFADTAFRIEQVEFADGTVWNAAYIQSAARIRGTAGVDYLAGSAGDDYLEAYAGNDSLNGGAGNDTLDGGTGNDDLYGETGNDIYLFASGDGQDTISDYDAAAGNVDTLRLAPGIARATVMLSLSGYNLILAINGASNTVTMQDYFEATGAFRIEQISFSDGTVWNYNTVSSMLGVTINGTAEDDWLDGTFAADTINGFGGNDQLNGDLGADKMAGGAGDDTYLVDDTGDVVNENANEGIDIVQSAITYILAANVENLSLTGTGTINATGNALNNILTGNGYNNVLSGGGGNDTLNGGTGADTLNGGTGDDIYVVDNAGDIVTENASEGVDTVQSAITYTLSANVESLTLTGSAVINGTGNTLNNILIGNSAVNVLNGGSGADTMAGGLGNDTYVVDNTSDVVNENALEGTDLVQSTVTYTLSANVEDLTLTGSAAVNGTGNTLNNVLTGNSGNNILTGGAGNDTYVVTAGDSVVENASEGTDTVKSAVTYTLTANIENLTLTGSAAVNGTGNTLNNVLTGNTGVNILSGSDGNDTLTGGTGADNLTGGAGEDIFKYVALTDGGDIITDFSQSGPNGNDLVDMSTIDANSGVTGNQAFAYGGTTATVNGVWYAESGGNTVLNLDTNGNTATIEMTITLTGISLGLSAADFAL